MCEMNSSDEGSGQQPSETPPGATVGATGWWSRCRRAVIGFFCGYVVLAMIIGFLQRRFIYHPVREKSIPAQQSGLPNGTVSDVTISTHDGLQLRGWHMQATGISSGNQSDADAANARSRPLVLFFPGNAGNRRHRVVDFEIFGAMGVDMMLVDYRGYGDNPGSPTESHIAADVRAVWEHAVKTRGGDFKGIYLFGESLGGGVATRLASELCREGTPPAGLMLRATFASLVDTGAYHFPYLPVRWIMQDRFPSVERIPHVTCPILHVHGALDRIVPMHMGQRLFDAVPDESAGGIPKRFIELPHAGHNNILHVAHAEFCSAIAQFFDSVESARSQLRNR